MTPRAAKTLWAAASAEAPAGYSAESKALPMAAGYHRNRRTIHPADFQPGAVLRVSVAPVKVEVLPSVRQNREQGR